MTLTELNVKKEALQSMLKTLNAIDTGCTQCDHFMQGKCLKFNAQIPPEFVAKGCEDWEWDGIPF
jgi:hypothetical protein